MEKKVEKNKEQSKRTVFRLEFPDNKTYSETIIIKSVEKVWIISLK